MPAGEPVQERVDVPDPPVIDVDDRVQDRLVEFVDTPRLTVPVKPFSGATVRVEVPVAPARTGTDVGLAVKEKSATGAVTEIVRVTLGLTRGPEVALI